MKLEFYSIIELEQFLMFSAHIGKAFAVAPSQMDQATVSRNGASAEPDAQPLAGDQAGNGAGAETAGTVVDAPAAAEQGEDGPLMADGGAAEAPKRKRRTKAEMQAALSGADSTATTEMDGVTPVSSERMAVAVQNGANPFAVAPAMQAVLDAPNQSAATLAAMAATQNADTAPAAPRVIESIEHLRACQGFIQKHGMAKYNETFRDGLNANIAIYTPEQRAQHVTILESLDA